MQEERKKGLASLEQLNEELKEIDKGDATIGNKRKLGLEEEK